MENTSNNVESHEFNLSIDQQGTPAATKSSGKPPSGPVRWKPNNSRKRTKITNRKVIQPKEQDPQGAGIGSKQNSWVWEHFQKFEKDRNPRAGCKYCGHSYAARPKMHDTGNLINHLQLQCKKYPYRLVDDKQKKLVYANDASSLTLKSVSYSYEECRLKLVEMVILNELPFKIVEGEGFKRYSACLQPRFTFPSCITIARDCMKLYFDEKNKLRSLIKFERVCLSTDTWTSIQNIDYMCLTAHWIDKEWRLQKRILSFYVISDHKGKTIGKMIESRLFDWGIDKILTITVDNPSSNDGAIKYAIKNTRGWRTTILNHEFLHVRCCAHILNLIVKDGLKEQTESIPKIRNGVRYVRSSPARLKTFTKYANVEKIESKSSVCLDIKTMWNSTYLMWEAATKFEKAFERLKEVDSNYKIYFKLGDKDDEENDRDQLIDGEQTSEKREAKDSKYIGPPNEDDWTVARSFIKFLKVFYDVTKEFSSSLQVTSNSFLQEIVVVNAKLKYLSRHNDPKVSLMGLKMQEMFVKYWESFDKLNIFLFMLELYWIHGTN